MSFHLLRRGVQFASSQLNNVNNDPDGEPKKIELRSAPLLAVFSVIAIALILVLLFVS